MFSHADLYDRVDNDGLIDFAKMAEDDELLDPDEVPTRFIFLTPTCVAELLAWDDSLQIGALAELSRFLVGKTIYWGDFREGNHMKPLNPATRWVEFKNRTAPQTRLYGCFVDQDHFIALHACLRKDQPDIDDFLMGRWITLWGEDVPRLCIDDPASLLTNYTVIE